MGSRNNIYEQLSGLDGEPITENPQLIEVSEAYEQIAACRRAFFETSAAFYELPDEERRASLVAVGSNMVSLVAGTTNLIQEKFGLENRSDAMFSLIMIENKKRAKRFRKLTGHDDFRAVSHDHVRAVLQQFEEGATTPEEYTEAVTVQFGEWLTGDMNDLFVKATTNYQRQLATTCTVIFRALSGQDEGGEPKAEREYAFSIEPPRQIHDPHFMGKNVTFTTSDSNSTYGRVLVPELEADSPEESSQARLEHLVKTFYAGLNPLGRLTMRIIMQKS